MFEFWKCLVFKMFIFKNSSSFKNVQVSKYLYLQKLLGFDANNKKIICYATPNMFNDLSISNVVTVGVWICTLIDQNAGITLPHKR
jgi:hypothetical protein